MDREKLKLIIRNLESLIDCLKSEINSDEDPYEQKPQYEDIAPYIDDYDEVFYDNENDDYDDLSQGSYYKYKLTSEK